MGVILPIFVITTIGLNTGGGLSKTSVDMRDINGDGVVDLLFSKSDGSLSAALGKIGTTNLLATVSNVKFIYYNIQPIDYVYITRPGGSKYSVEYTEGGLEDKNPHFAHILSKLSLFDGFSGDGTSTFTNSYEFKQGVYNYQGMILALLYIITY